MDRPLTISEKILIGHLDESADFGLLILMIVPLNPLARDYVLLNPDRVALQRCYRADDDSPIYASRPKTNRRSNNSSLRSSYSGKNRK